MPDIAANPLSRPTNNAADHQACRAKPVSRPASLYRHDHRHRFLDRSGDRANGAVRELRTDGNDNDRARVSRSLDRAARHQELRSAVADGRGRARAGAIGRRRGRCHSDPGELCAVADVGRRHDAGVHHRLGPESSGFASLERGGGQARCAAHPRRGRDRPVLFRAARVQGAGRHRRDPRSQGAGAGCHQRYSLVHDDAVRLYRARPGADLHRDAAQ
jgi:hypothetical protein